MTIEPEAPPSTRTLVLSIGGAALASALATGLAFRALTPIPHAPVLRRFEIVANVSRLAGISPDGKSIAYVDDGKLLLRPLDSFEPTVVTTPAAPSALFWSTDSSHLGFAAGEKFWKVPASGGGVTAIADIGETLTGGASASWCPDGSIVLSTGNRGILRVPPGGGDLKEVGDIHEPTCLADGSILYGRPDSLWIFADGKSREILRVEPDQDIGSPVYSPAGFILYHRHPASAGIWALPFSLPKRRATGEPFLVVANGELPSVSRDGTLAYVRSSGAPEDLGNIMVVENWAQQFRMAGR